MASSDDSQDEILRLEQGQIVYAGPSLCNAEVIPIHILFNPAMAKGFDVRDQSCWNVFLNVIHMELAESQ